MSGSATTRRADLALLAVSVLWGVSFPAIKMATPYIPAVRFVAVRFALASLLLLALRPSLGGSLARRRGVALGLLLTVGYTTQTIGLHTTTAANSAFITCLSVVLVPVVAGLRHWQRPAPATLAALAPALAGLALLTRPDLGRPVAGDLWTLGCALAYAIYLVELSRALAAAPYIPLLVWQVLTVAILTGAWALLVERGDTVWNGTVGLSLVLTTLLSTLLALYLQNRFQGRTTSMRAALIFTTEPVFATLFAALLLRERLPGAFAGGAALILSAVLLAELGDRRAAAAPEETS